MLRPVIAGHAGCAQYEDTIAAYVFSATLAIQDITGSEHSGVSSSHVLKRLEGSNESRSYLFALTRNCLPRPLGQLGYPEIAPEDLLEVEAWVFVSLPLLEDLSVIEAHITLDALHAPMPGQEVPAEPWQAALELVDALSTTLNRPVRHVWVTLSAGAPAPIALAASGYHHAYAETQAEFGISHFEQSCDVVENFAFSPQDLESVIEVLRTSSANYPRGSLLIDTIDWTEKRFHEASTRLIDRGGTQLSALSRNAEGRVVGMAEIVHFDADADNLCELGLVYVLPEHRGQGHATAMIYSALAAAKEKWPKVNTCFLSYPADDAAATAIAQALGAQTLSLTAAWQKTSGLGPAVDSCPGRHFR
ncbi:GNAT family N-acetyltransferase [Corynebacterium mayonis]|uniref:GNAT family N-acetyltransferase n=1 Tax=Corynebacterium mayonis TaxID=3062461 RepID=UPI003140B75B